MWDIAAIPQRKRACSLWTHLQGNFNTLEKLPIKKTFCTWVHFRVFTAKVLPGGRRPSMKEQQKQAFFEPPTKDALKKAKKFNNIGKVN